MTRTMYDSTDVADIPAHATMVAGYVDGRYANVTQLRKRFPAATVVTITVIGSADAHVADCESGDLTPSSAAAWAHRELGAGRKPTIYCPLSQWAAVKQAVDRLGDTGRIGYWVAHYGPDSRIPAGALAIQYADPTTSGGHYDTSHVVDYWPGVDPPKPRPTHRRLRVRRRTLRRMIRTLRRLLKGTAR